MLFEEIFTFDQQRDRTAHAGAHCADVLRLAFAGDPIMLAT